MQPDRVIIDGSFGEGGGQIVRSAVALAAVTGRPLVMENIRAGRKPAGLKRQHVTAVTAAAEICGATVAGATVGSQHLEFQPDRPRAGEYSFTIGTAGSTTLVMQTVLPALLVAEGPSTVTLSGGTHNPWAPPFDFIERVYLPLINRMGPATTAKLDRPGFYPAGGGQWKATTQPAGSLHGFDLTERRRLIEQRVTALVARLPRQIGERECDTAVRKLGWPKSSCHVQEISDSACPGNAVMVELRYEHVTAIFTGFGQRGVKAEKVAAGAAREAKRYLATDVPVDEHLADQLLLPLGIAAHLGGKGGTFRTLTLSRHAVTHVEILRKFLDIEIDVAEHERDNVTVRISRIS